MIQRGWIGVVGEAVRESWLVRSSTQVQVRVEDIWTMITQKGAKDQFCTASGVIYPGIATWSFESWRFLWDGRHQPSPPS